MSQQNNMRKVLLMALSEPEYARIDYWIAEQEKGSYRKLTFIKKLLDAHKHYEYAISKRKAEFKVLNPEGTVSNPGIPLFYETDGELTGHLNHKVLTELGSSIVELYKLWYPEKQETKIKQDNIQPIHWLKGVESLRQFIEELKSAVLIESRETEEIIQEHFSVDNQVPTKEAKPINWLGTTVLLAYLIKELTIKPKMHDSFMESKNLWQVTNLHFTIKGKEIHRSLVNDIKQSRYPNGCNKIDTILKRLS